MANGAQCCALEICCPPGEAASRQKRARLLADAVGATDPAVGHALIDWMEREGLTFAPASFRAVVEEIVTATRKSGNG